MSDKAAGLFLPAVIFAFIFGLVLAALILPRLDESQVYMVLGLGIFILFGIGFVFNPGVKARFTASKRVAEDVQVMMSSNPAHRISMEDAAGMQELSEAINTFADRHQDMLDSQADRIEQANATVEDEKNKLATLISELTEGVIVCNNEGRILLYNNVAALLLGREIAEASDGEQSGFVGLGRSVFSLIDRNVITDVLDNLDHHFQTTNTYEAVQFVTVAANGQLIRAKMSPIITPQNEMRGFILNLDDVTQQAQVNYQRYRFINSLVERTRLSLANIRAAIETIQQYPEMEAAKRGQLQNIIQEETLLLSDKLTDSTTGEAADLNMIDWRMEELLGTDLLWAVQHSLQSRLNISVEVENHQGKLWLKVDGYAIVLAMSYIMGRLKEEYGIDAATLRLKNAGHLAALDLVWLAGKTDLADLWAWQYQELTSGVSLIPISISDVAEAHGGEVWYQEDAETDTTYFRLLLPTTRPKPERDVRVVHTSRPEFYDFDLFFWADKNPELDKTQLIDLTYTVFDTETTGLNPSQGDEIISISAVRIVNGRLLRQETFDQLVDPHRRLSPKTVEITGISANMLEGQPTIDKVLPAFYEFAKDTVLVAHNAAFDMRFFQLKEQTTGVKFSNPVLDTLLLSAVTHPHQTDHRLEVIAERLGVNVIGRHTSLGDAIVTGEAYLKLVQLLTNKEITTLAQARNAAQETYFARIDY